MWNNGQRQGIFSGCPCHIRILYFTLFLTKFTPLPKCQKAPKNLYFRTNFKQFPGFYPFPLTILGLSFKLYNAPLSAHYRNYISQNFVFNTYAYSELSRRTLGVKLTPSPIRIGRVKEI